MNPVPSGLVGVATSITTLTVDRQLTPQLVYHIYRTRITRRATSNGTAQVVLERGTVLLAYLLLGAIITPDNL